jgi:hypothetical protein
VKVYRHPVTLTGREVDRVALEVTARHLRYYGRGYTPKHTWGYDGKDLWSVNFRALAAELALHKVLDRYWSPGDMPDRDGDVGLGLQVRHSLKSTNRLILYPSDQAHHVFVFVWGEIPTLTIVGGIKGCDGMCSQYWGNCGVGRPDAWLVPQDALKPLVTRRNGGLTLDA